MDLRHLRHGLATLATWTCDTDSRVDFHTRAVDRLRTGWPSRAESLSPSAEHDHMDPPRRIHGDCDGDTRRLSRWIIVKVAALAGGRHQPSAMGAPSPQDRCAYKGSCSNFVGGHKSA